MNAAAETRDRIKTLTRHTYGPWARQKTWRAPVMIADAEGVCIYDDAGKRYLDFSSQLMCANLGHKNRAVIEAIVKQAEKMPYMAPGFATEAECDAVEALLSVMPAGLDKFFFSTSGTEANEAALKMVRQSKAPAYKVISRYHSYHGATLAGAAFTGDPRRFPAEAARCVAEGVRFAPDCYCYRCPFGLKYPDCDIRCARYLDYMIKEEGNVAAVIVEPVPGTNGRIVPPPEYFPLLRRICDENDVLLIADEVMTGWFRTGPAFAMENWGVTPDILTTAKGSTAAYTPLGITASGKKVSEFFEDEMFCHGHTYAYHALACSALPAAAAEYRRIVDSGLCRSAAAHLKKRLYGLADRHPCVGDVRGMGHFWGLEIVQDRETRVPFNVKMDKLTGAPLMTGKIAADAMKRGVFLNAWIDTLVIAPPLIITPDEIDEAVEALDMSLKIGDREAKDTGLPPSHSSEF
ncbi:conserved hypothetical protein [Candidatus Desulfarcum epimagneticum]|uniref:Aspartate aminotransferase family protein n=1 Tax=uncultured Desulfobacteraceae bacterium TaxID=218296 RepID=A0A484HMA0_9BACT|nr:conserved hypothetical protein [uncultured Desulfobacteraceae bacterium]